VDRLLKKVGLDGARKIQLRKYSKGMLQRAGLAQAMLHDPEVLILELKREGRTILFSTHILPDAEMICDRVAVVVGGKLRGVGSPDQIVSVKVRGMEILFEPRGARPLPAALAGQATQIGNRRRIEVAEADLYSALEQLKTAGAGVLSVTQIKSTLEDYFLDLVGAERATPHAVEVSEK
jgi:ABC-2 type transport system ATP-binding protein